MATTQYATWTIHFVLNYFHWLYLQLIKIHFHTTNHHHHLFLKRPFLPRSARVRRSPQYEASPHIPEHCPFSMYTKLLHIILHTFIPSLSPSTRTSHPCHHHVSTGRYPIISTLTFHMPKPPQSTIPHHFCHALNTQKTVQVLTSLPILQRHPTHPSHHHAICSLQAMQIVSLHCPCLSPIYQHALDTGPKNLPFHYLI